MTEILLLILGLMLGAAAGWLAGVWRARSQVAGQSLTLQNQLAASEAVLAGLREQLGQRDRELAGLREAFQSAQQERVAAQVRAEEMQRHLAEQRQLLEQAEVRLREAFAALSSEALKVNSAQFAQQAEEKVRPLAEALARYEEHLRGIEQARAGAYGALTEQLREIAGTHQQLQRQTSSLVNALRTPGVKGRWGELQLQRTVELCGMSSHCDFVPQQSLETEEGRLRPDLIVRLPGDRLIVIDAKVSTDAYLDAASAEDEAARREALGRYVRAVRTHMQGLAAKSYWQQLQRLPQVGHSPEFVVMFVPGEAFFSTALQEYPQLIEEGIQQRVIVASPTTLIAMLLAIANAWQQQQVVENAHQIGNLARQLLERVCKFAEHLENIGDHLRRAGEAYSAAVGSYESRVRPVGRRLNELGISGAQLELPELPSVEIVTRPVTVISPVVPATLPVPRPDGPDVAQA